MDIPRDPAYRRGKRRRRCLVAVAAGVTVATLSVAISNVQPALPAVTGEALWIRPVQRGPMIREVRGTGTLVPESAHPTRLKAEIRVAETQANDLMVGQSATVRTGRGLVRGHVARIAPPHGGTVGLDITLDAALPPAARSERNVAATIEVERMSSVLFMESPPSRNERTTVSLFKVVSTGHVERTPVRVGRRSVQFVEVVDGLAEGDRVVVSDMSQYQGFRRLRLQ
jgi:HlyD family secretion protein